MAGTDSLVIFSISRIQQDSHRHCGSRCCGCFKRERPRTQRAHIFFHCIGGSTASEPQTWRNVDTNSLAAYLLALLVLSSQSGATALRALSTEQHPAEVEAILRSSTPTIKTIPRVEAKTNSLHRDCSIFARNCALWNTWHSAAIFNDTHIQKVAAS